MRARTFVPTIVLLLCAQASPVLAWGALGHRLVSRVAAEQLPPSLPPFVRSADAVAEISALGPEADRLKGSGKTWDADADKGHFVDASDDGTIAGAVSLGALPVSREAYDTALRKAGTDQYRAGYVPYEIIDGYEQLVTDFAYWRADAAGEQRGVTPEDRAYFALDRRLRETLTLRDIGYWSHFVADASQPLHASVHYNGWGDYPNPKNYSTSHTIHARFETALVNAVATDSLVTARIKPYVPSSDPIEQRVGAYLQATLANVPRVYDIEAAGGIDARSPDATSLVLDRLAAGATMLRDLTADAWAASSTQQIGYPRVSVGDIESGKVPLTKALFGAE